MASDPSIRPIALFLPSLNGGGAERVFITLANEFSRQVSRPVHLVMARSGGILEDDVDPAVKVVDLGQSRVMKSLLPLVAYLRDERPQVLLSTMWEANIVALLARKLARVELRTVIREANILRQAPEKGIGPLKQAFARLLMKQLYPGADAMVVIAADVLSTLQSAGIEPCSNRIYIGNPVSIREPSAMHTSACYLTQGRPYICSVGRLAEQKGFDTLIDAFAKLPERELDLVVLGEGPLRDRLTDQARRLGIAHRVHLTGFIKQPGSVVSQARLFVSSSRWEGFPNAIMEALSVGAPVVATSCPGASRDILASGRYGHLVPEDDPDALAAAIELALVQPASTPEARIARSRQYSPARIASRYLSEALQIPQDRSPVSTQTASEAPV